MNVQVEDFKTGWFGITIGLKKKDIDQMIKCLKRLQSTKDHFHFRSTGKTEKGVSDVEFFWADDNSSDNMEIDDSEAIYPK